MTEEHTIKNAATLLGTSEGAIRQRLRRGTLRSSRRGGRVYVILDGTEQSGTHESDTRTSEPEVEVALLREQVEWLRGEVQRKDAILLNMTEAMKALSPPERESRESPETEEPQEGASETSRRWWEFWR